MFEIYRMIHILFMALWLASIVKGLVDALTLTGTIRKSAELRKRYSKFEEIFGITSGMGTILTGLWLIFEFGGFSSVSWPIHAGLSIAIVMALIGAFGVGRMSDKIAKAINEGLAVKDLSKEAKQLTFWSVCTLVLWLCNLTLMCLRHLF